MLVLSRKNGENVIIIPSPGYDECNVVVKVIEIRGDKVRLGFEASKDVLIYREEVWLEIQKAKIRKEATDAPSNQTETAPAQQARPNRAEH